MQQNVSSSWRTDPEKCANDTGSRHGGFEDVGLKPLIEKIGGAHGHELDQVVFVLGWERLESLAEEKEFFQIARIERCRIGRNHSEQRLDEMAHRYHSFAELVVGFGIDAGVPGDGAASLGVVVDAPQVFSLEHGSEGAVERKDFKTVTRQIEIANDFRAEERNYVGTNGKLKAGKYFFGYCRAAQDVALFED